MFLLWQKHQQKGQAELPYSRQNSNNANSGSDPNLSTKLKCDSCEKTFRSESLLEKHVRLRHTQEGIDLLSSLKSGKVSTCNIVCFSFLPPAHVVRTEGNIFSLFVRPPEGGGGDTPAPWSPLSFLLSPRRTSLLHFEFGIPVPFSVLCGIISQYSIKLFFNLPLVTITLPSTTFFFPIMLLKVSCWTKTEKSSVI